MKILATIALLSSLIFQQPCATVSLSLGQTQVQQGGSQSIETTVANCGEKKTKFQLTLTVTDAVGSTVLVRNEALNLNPAQSLVVQNTYSVGASAPLGTYRVITIVFHTANGNTTELVRDVEEFQVVAAE